MAEIVRVKPTEGWATHERRRKSVDRKTLPLKAEVFKLPKLEDPAQAHWNSIVSTVNNTFNQNPEILERFNKNKKFFRRFASGRRNVTLGLNTSDYLEMVEVFFNEESPRYDNKYLKVITEGSDILKLITSETLKLTRGNGKY